MPAFSRSVGYLGHAWCRSDSQILARNGVFVVTVACKSKTTQSALCLDAASAECQAITPRKRRMRISSVACGISNAHGRKSRYQDTGRSLLWCAVVSTRSPAAGRARATPPAGYWVRWRRPPERAHARCAVRSDHAERWRGPRAERRPPPTAAATAGNSRAAATPGPRGAIAITGPLGSVPGRA